MATCVNNGDFRYGMWAQSDILMNKQSNSLPATWLYSVHENSLRLPVTLAQLMRPGIGWNASYTVGGFA